MQYKKSDPVNRIEIGIEFLITITDIYYSLIKYCFIKTLTYESKHLSIYDKYKITLMPVNAFKI